MSILSRSDISICHSQSMLLRFVIFIAVVLYFVIFIAVLLYLSLFFGYIYRRFVINRGFIYLSVIFTAVLLYLSLFCYIYRRVVIFIAVLLYSSRFHIFICYIYRCFFLYKYVIANVIPLVNLSYKCKYTLNVDYLKYPRRRFSSVLYVVM